jgi:hypothetical protein
MLRFGGTTLMQRALTSLICVLALTGCASVDSIMLSEDTAMISAEGNGPSDRDRIIRDALAEAARVTTAHGFRYFVVLTADDVTRTMTVTIPGRVLYNQPPRSTEAFGTFSGRAYAGASTYATPERKEERVRPAMEIMIRMYHDGEIEQADGVWDASKMPSPVIRY